MYGIGRALPSPENKVAVIVRVTVEGSGKDRYMNGSNVIEILWQAGQTKVDLY